MKTSHSLVIVFQRVLFNESSRQSEIILSPCQTRFSRSLHFKCSSPPSSIQASRSWTMRATARDFLRLSLSRRKVHEQTTKRPVAATRRLRLCNVERNKDSPSSEGMKTVPVLKGSYSRNIARRFFAPEHHRIGN